MPVPPTEIISAIAGFGGVSFAPEKSHILVNTFPCPGSDALGLEYRSDLAPTSSRYYIGSSVPDFGSTVTLRGPSDPQTVGGFINVDPGFGNVFAFDPSSDTEVAKLPVAVRPGWTNYLYLDLRGKGQ